MHDGVYISMCILMSRVQSEAKAMLDQLVKENGDAATYQYAGIYAQWGDMKTALKWIERAYEVKDRATLSSGRP
jgi:tetratricopeptide (TPR) repeat protein